jgi:uncharacterized protein (TIGR00369 family)
MPHSQPKNEIERRIKHLFEDLIVFNQTLGLRVLSLDASKPRIGFAFSRTLLGSPAHQVLHGGVTAAVLDAMGGFAIMLALAAKYSDDTPDHFMTRFRKLGTIDMRIDYVTPGRGQSFIASGQVLRLGNKIANTQMRMENEEGTLIATGAAAYIVG